MGQVLSEYFFHDELTPAQMDWLWAHGWRHFGTYFYRYSSTQQGPRRLHVLPLRIRLDSFQPSKSQRRVLKRNGDLRLEFRPAFVDAEVEALFERHRVRFKDNVPDSIYTFVSERPAELPCRCLSLCAYWGEQLVGISYLDVGETACSSVYQCFDPDLSRRSLGVFMVLCSVEYSLQIGKTHYYHGYAYEESSHYDYKKKFAALERFDWRGRWQRAARLKD